MSRLNSKQLQTPASTPSIFVDIYHPNFDFFHHLQILPSFTRLTSFDRQLSTMEAPLGLMNMPQEVLDMVLGQYFMIATVEVVPKNVRLENGHYHILIDYRESKLRWSTKC